jgi:hypothetical protein
MRNLFFALLAVAGMGSAHAGLSIMERKSAQMIVLTLEIASIVTIIVIGIVVWQIAKRDSDARKAREENGGEPQ